MEHPFREGVQATSGEGGTLGSGTQAYGLAMPNLLASLRSYQPHIMPYEYAQP